MNRNVKCRNELILDYKKKNAKFHLSKLTVALFLRPRRVSYSIVTFYKKKMPASFFLFFPFGHILIKQNKNVKGKLTGSV